MKPLIAGNWKMNGLATSLTEVEAIASAAAELSNVELLLCPPAVLTTSFVNTIKGRALAVGGQDCHAEASGAHTGDISAEMLKDCGARYVIVGHSERRADHRESNPTVAAKAKAALRAGIMPIICVGETLEEREAGKALEVVSRQLRGSLPAGASVTNITIAYEPVWAIGTGKIPTNIDIAEVHLAIRRLLNEKFGAAASKVRILYGGSVKPVNAREILAVANVNGALVGGASLKAADFLGIARAV